MHYRDHSKLAQYHPAFAWVLAVCWASLHGQLPDCCLLEIACAMIDRGHSPMVNNSEIQQLLALELDIKNEIAHLQKELDQFGVGLHQPLVDSHGYPLAHLDLVQIRSMRQRINCLVNDHKSLMDRISNLLPLALSNNSTNISQNGEPNSCKPTNTMQPFAKVDAITPLLPASAAGIQVNDLICQFGSIQKSNFKHIQDLAIEFRSNPLVQIIVQRRYHYVTISIANSTQLGMHIIPL